MMRHSSSWTRLVAALSVAAVGACAQGEQSGQAADTTARNLTLATPESTAAMRDVPAEQPNAPPPTAPQPKTATPRTRPPAAKPNRSPAATTWSLGSGTHFDMAAADTISSRTSKVGDPFTARVVEDVKDAAGHVVIPAGSVVNGTITDVKPAPNPSTSGTLTLAVSSITVRGTNYPIDASVDSLETKHQGRGVERADAAKVGAGAAAGALVGRLIGKNAKGTVIGGIVGAAVGAGVAAKSKDSDIVLPAGAHILVTVTKALVVKAGG